MRRNQNGRPTTTAGKLKKVTAAINAGGLTPEQLAKKQARQTFLQQKQKQAKQGSNGNGGGRIPAKLDKANSPGDLWKLDKKSEKQEAGKDVGYQNPNITNPLGSQQTTVDQNGNVNVTQQLSPEQQQILNQGQNLTQAGQNAQMNYLHQPNGPNSVFQPNLTPRTGTGDLLKDRARIEADAYARLTQNLNRDKAQELADTERTLYNRGIALDPRNEQYKLATQQLNERYDAQKQAAARDATAMGGEEYSRSFGIGEQTRANDLSNAVTQRGQQWSDVQNLGQLGTGLMMPNFQPYQGPNYDPSKPSELYNTYNQLQQSQQQINNQASQFGQSLSLQQQQLAQNAANQGNQDDSGLRMLRLPNTQQALAPVQAMAAQKLGYSGGGAYG